MIGRFQIKGGGAWGAGEISFFPYQYASDKRFDNISCGNNEPGYHFSELPHSSRSLRGGDVTTGSGIFQTQDSNGWTSRRSLRLWDNGTGSTEALTAAAAAGGAAALLMYRRGFASSHRN